MMLLIGESSMSNAHLVNGAVVNVRARVRLNPSFIILGYDKVITDDNCFHTYDENLIDPQFHQGDKLGVWLADAREEEGVSCHNHNLLFVSLLSKSRFVSLFLGCQNLNLFVCFFFVTNTIYLERHKDKDPIVVTIMI